MSALRQTLLLLLLALVWSPSFLFIKLAVTEISPITVVALRVSIGALLLLLLLWWRGVSLPKSKSFWLRTTVVAFFSSTLPFCLFCYAETTIESALAAIINGTTPMFTALLAHLYIPTDRLHPQKILGIALSVGGLVLLFTPNILSGFNGDSFGMLAATGASISYAISHILTKKMMVGQKPCVAPTAQLICSMFLILPVLAMQGALTIPSALPSYSAMIGVLGLAVLGTFIAFIIYYELIEVSGPTAVSMVSCCFPVGGMVLGYLFLEETLSFYGVIAALLILMGIVTVNELFKEKKEGLRLEAEG